MGIQAARTFRTNKKDTGSRPVPLRFTFRLIPASAECYLKGDTTMPQFISKIDFAKSIGVSISTVDRGIRNHQRPYCQFVKIGSRVLYPASLLAELEERALQHAAQASVKEASDGDNT